jgi:hypothetical protein
LRPEEKVPVLCPTRGYPEWGTVPNTRTALLYVALFKYLFWNERQFRVIYSHVVTSSVTSDLCTHLSSNEVRCLSLSKAPAARLSTWNPLKFSAPLYTHKSKIHFLNG